MNGAAFFPACVIQQLPQIAQTARRATPNHNCHLALAKATMSAAPTHCPLNALHAKSKRKRQCHLPPPIFSDIGQGKIFSPSFSASSPCNAMASKGVSKRGGDLSSNMLQAIVCKVKLARYILVICFICPSRQLLKSMDL